MKLNIYTNYLKVDFFLFICYNGACSSFLLSPRLWVGEERGFMQEVAKLVFGNTVALRAGRSLKFGNRYPSLL